MMTVKQLRAALFDIEDQAQEVTPEMLAELMEEEYGNQTVINLSLKRIEVCNLLLATLAAHEGTEGRAEKWMQLHEKIGKQLHETDKAHGWK